MKPQDSLPLVDLRPLPVATGASRLRVLPGTLWRLGLPALARYARHRLAQGSALSADAPLPEPPFLHAQSHDGPGIDWFGAVPRSLRSLPALSVPTSAGFDIRLVWEAGRLVDLPALAAHDPAAAEGMVRDFVRSNPPFRGPHWACGQEAAIRLAHLLSAQQGSMLPGFAALVALHRTRIEATLAYAMAQDNNHAISEAAGLWAAGLALADDEAARRGRALLQRAVLRLFAASGAFSQHSMRYHVVALEMAAFAQRFALSRSAPGLPDAACARLSAGTEWLRRITAANGRAWRVGHDDSSRLFGDSLDDVRPTLSRARVFSEPPPPLRGRDGEAGGAARPTLPASVRVDPAPPHPGPPPQGGREAPSVWLDAEGGFASLSLGPLRAFLRLPVQKFRPSQADALHLDVWHGGDCLLGDAGTHLYNDPAGPDLSRTAAHSTIAFDDDDQMPRLSRFLYGAWLRPTSITATADEIGAAYRDWKGRMHTRSVRLGGDQVQVADAVGGRFTRACLRWRLPEGAWVLSGQVATGGGLAITIVGAESLRLVRAPAAPRYGSLASRPVLEAEIVRPGGVSSLIRLAPARERA